jgi:nitrite reductase (cytochrome c-552)
MLKDHVDIARKQNAVCLQCKSTPVAYYWGENRRGMPMFNKGMPWADIIAKLKTDNAPAMEYGASCNHCHDPHLGGYRVIRKAMIASVLERGTDPYSAKFNVVPKTQDELIAKMNERDPATGKLTPNARRLAGTLTCAQCHVEYTCGPGADSSTGILRDDFPWRKLKDLEAYYQVKFDMWQDWKHSVTGTNGVKAQHPETEFYWGSKHYELGVACSDCHMAKGAGGGLDKPAKDHWLTSPLKQVASTCGNCHSGDADDKVKKVQEWQDAFWAKSQQTEAALTDALKAIEAAKATGGTVTEAVAQASALFLRGLLWWEFTAVSENSTGAHNYSEGLENLGKADEFAKQAKAALAK